MVTVRSIWVLISSSLLALALSTACSQSTAPASESPTTTTANSDYGDIPTLRFNGTFIRLDERTPMPSTSECSTDSEGKPNGFKWATEDGRNVVEARFTLAKAGGSTVQRLRIVAGAETLIDQTYQPGGELLGSITQQGQSNDFLIGSQGPSNIDDRRPQYDVAFRCQDAETSG